MTQFFLGALSGVVVTGLGACYVIGKMMQDHTRLMAGANMRLKKAQDVIERLTGIRQ